MNTYDLSTFKELSQAGAADIAGARVIKPEYGRILEDFAEGDVYQHPRGFTIDHAFAQEYATTFMEANPLYLSAEYARKIGFRDQLVAPLMVFNLALSMGVQNDSEKAMANLGYYNAFFLRPVYPGDTLTALTKILAVANKGVGKPGIVSVRTIALNQNGEVVLQYERKIMIKAAGAPSRPRGDYSAAFPEVPASELKLRLPVLDARAMPQYTGTGTYFEDFKVGDIIVHKNGRTITDEHMPWTFRVGNTHPLHYDRMYSQAQEGPMSGNTIVYGGLVFGWLAGMASRDISENALWEIGFHEGYHTQPAFSGDTVTALSRVLAVEDGPVPGCGTLQIQFIGFKNIKAADALEKFGADVFLKENEKKDKGKEKLPQKIFEIERRLLIKKRG